MELIGVESRASIYFLKCLADCTMGHRPPYQVVPVQASKVLNMAYDTYSIPSPACRPTGALGPASRPVGHLDRTVPPAPGGVPAVYGKAQQDAMVTRHAPMVRKLALRLLARLPASVELDDLIQAGMMGLLDAVKRYREVPTAQFETYATQRVRGAMLDELRSNDWIPRGVRERSRRIEQAIHVLGNRLARAPTEAEIAEEMGIALGDYHTILQEAHGSQLLYFDDLGSDPEQFLSHEPGDDPIHAQETDDPLAALMAKGLRGALTAAIEQLPDREKLLLSLYYEQGLNLKEIGLVLNVGEARVCQLRSQAISRLRASIIRYEAGD